MTKVAAFISLITLFSLNPLNAQERDNTANLGDRLDRNTVPSELELRKDEIPNRPDSTDLNEIPSHSEERMREEEVEPVEIENEFEIIDPSENSE